MPIYRIPCSVSEYCDDHFKTKQIMRTLQVKISDTDIQRYKLEGQEIKFTDLVDKISLEYARRSLLEANEIAEKTGLSKMTLDEINAEIKAVRDAKTHS